MSFGHDAVGATHHRTVSRFPALPGEIAAGFRSIPARLCSPAGPRGAGADGKGQGEGEWYAGAGLGETGGDWGGVGLTKGRMGSWGGDGGRRGERASPGRMEFWGLESLRPNGNLEDGVQ